MFKIKWRNRNSSMSVIEGLSRYSTIEKAEQQIARWNGLFPLNTYYIERV